MKRGKNIYICKLAGYWSVRIDGKNRIVFSIYEEQIEVIQCGTYYREK